MDIIWLNIWDFSWPEHFLCLSTEVWSYVDTCSWQVDDIVIWWIKPNINTISNDIRIKRKNVGNMRSLTKYSWNWGEAITREMLWAKKNKNNSWYDLYLELPGWKIVWIEVKTTVVWWTCVIKKPQLEGYISSPEWTFYSLVYYRTKSWLKPKVIYEIWWLKKFRKEIYIDSIFIFPLRYITYFYNTHPKKQCWGKNLDWTWVDTFKWINYLVAKQMFEDNLWWLNKEIIWGNIFTIWLKANI